MTDSSQKDTENTSGSLTILLSLFRFMLPYRSRLAGAMAALVITSGLTLSLGQGVKILIDDGFIGHSSALLNQATFLIMTIVSLMAVGTYIRFYLVSWLGERVSADIRKKVFDHIITLHPSYFETNRSGEIMSRITTDTTLLQNIIGTSLSMALRNTLTLIGAVTLLLITSFKLTLIVLLAVPVILMPILLFGRRVRRLSRASQDSIANVGSYVGEAIQHIKTVQSYTQEENEQRSFGKEVEQAFDVARQRIRQRALLIASIIFLVFGAIAGMLWVGGNDVLEGSMSGGELGAFVFYAVIVAAAVASLSEVYGELQRAAGATERLLELIQVPNNIIIAADTDAESDLQALEPKLKIKAVTFTYPSRPGQPALTDFTLTVASGTSLALVGPSGAGKSTVFELLQRFYDPQQGTVSFGDTDIRNLHPRDLRHQMALVSQQPALFSSSVAHNIRYGNPAATDDEIIAAAKAAHAHEFISRLPEGYNSYLGELGARLSGGQRQRIAIARAILKNPRILLLDEATSALDSESEYQVQQALDRLMQNRTTVIIAHRLSTILHVDKIAVLEQGKLVAEGSHESLLKSSPLYRRLAELQFRDDNQPDTDNKLADGNQNTAA